MYVQFTFCAQGECFVLGSVFWVLQLRLVYSGQTVALLLTPHTSHTAPVPLITYPVVPYTQKKIFFSKQKQTLNCSPQKQSPRGVCIKVVLRNTGKHLCRSLFFNKVTGLRPATLLKRRLWHRCFSVNFAKFLRTLFLIEHLRWLLLSLVKNS